MDSSRTQAPARIREMAEYKDNYEDLPNLLYADGSGIIYEHPELKMAGSLGLRPVPVESADLMVVPEFSKLFFLPDCPPIGLDPSTGEFEVVSEVTIRGRKVRCSAVATFLEPGIVRSLLPAAEYGHKRYLLPTWAYTAVGAKDDHYWAAGFWIERNLRWDPRNFDDLKLVPAIDEYKRQKRCGRLIEHLVNCAVNNHCFAAKNLFLKRWEAPIPVSRNCNARCLGCLSLQEAGSCKPSHQRIGFRPDVEEIVSVARDHLNHAPDAIVSFGQGCEGEPLTEYRLIAESIREIRKKTDRGTINLNTNGSSPERIKVIAESGLDSIRISMNSARPEYYRAYFRPVSYDFEDVISSIALSRELGLYAMVNYLVFPGITDQEEEIGALSGLIRSTGINFLHLKNLNIDPALYVQEMPKSDSGAVGMRKLVALLREQFPHLRIGYFNQPKN